jgi:hypothetical protein
MIFEAKLDALATHNTAGVDVTHGKPGTVSLWGLAVETAVEATVGPS